MGSKKHRTAPIDRHKHRRWLLQLTALPTAAGREHRVIDWVARWVARQAGVVMRADRYGNLLIMRRSRARRGRRGRRPIYFTAHVDHPGFVVTGVLDERTLEAEFRGGVSDRYFKGAAVVLHHEKLPIVRGRVLKLLPGGRRAQGRRVRIGFRRPVKAAPGDVLTWGVGPARIRGDRLAAPACDDLAAVAAALAAFDALGPRAPHVRVLLTRAEEVGFVGAIGACQTGTIPRSARVVALECSKSFADSPIGGGPIVRVGDRTSTFDPRLTYWVAQVAGQLAADDPSFRWQRRLMPGGTCEATAYQALGLSATCVCLPLGNYHNMHEKSGRLAAEVISLSDYDALVRLLVAIGKAPSATYLDAPLRKRLHALFVAGQGLLQ